MYTKVPLKLREIVADCGPNVVVVNPPELPGRTVRLVKPSKFAGQLKTAELDAHTLITTAEAHFAALGAAGLLVPAMEFYLDGGELFIVTDQIEGWPVGRQPRRQYPPDQAERPISAQDRLRYTEDAKAGLRAYGLAVADPNKPVELGGHVFYEKTQTTQYMVGVSAVRPEVGEGLWMVDPDATLIEATPAMINMLEVETDRLWEHATTEAQVTPGNLYAQNTNMYGDASFWP
jgi:hypothetical protein